MAGSAPRSLRLDAAKRAPRIAVLRSVVAGGSCGSAALHLCISGESRLKLRQLVAILGPLNLRRTQGVLPGRPGDQRVDGRATQQPRPPGKSR